MVRCMSMAWPSGASASSRALAPPPSCSVGAPDGRLTTPMSFMNTPRLKPVPTAFEKASLAAKRLANVPARVCGRDAALARSVSVKTRLRNLSPQRSSEFWIRSMLQRSEPMPTITKSSPRRGGEPCETWWRGPTHVAGARPWAPTTTTLRAAVPLPVPGRTYSPRLIHKLAHSADAGVEAGEDRLADQEMADVEFGDVRD